MLIWPVRRLGVGSARAFDEIMQARRLTKRARLSHMTV